jgi:3-oxoadipate enol-lactonase
MDDPAAPAVLREVELAGAPAGAHTTGVCDRPAAPGAPARPPLVLIHALGLDRRMWNPVLAALPADRRVIAYDLRGHGRAAGAAPAPTVHALAADLAALLDALGVPGPVTVAGLSMGGAVAQTFALDHPERTAALELLATGADPHPAYLERALAAEAEGLAPQVGPTLERWFSPAFLAAHPDAAPVRYARDSTARAAVADWAAAWRTLATVDVRARLRDIRVPVRLVAGGDDPSTPPALMATLAADLPNARLTVLPGLRHLLCLEAPDRVAELLAGEPG